MNHPTDRSTMWRSTPPAVSEINGIRLPELRDVTLSNGATIHIYDKCNSDICAMSVIMPCGAAEARSQALSTLSATLQCEGAAGLTGEEISGRLENNGVWFDSSATAHYTSHFIVCLNSRLKKVLPTLRDMLFHPDFPEEAIKKRRESLARNIEISETDVNFQSTCLSSKLIRGIKHPLAITDTPESIRNIGGEMLADFHKRHLCPRNTHIFLTGKIADDTHRIIAELFEEMPTQGVSSDLDIRGYEPAAAGTVETIEMPEAKQSSVIISFPAPPQNHPDYIPLSLTVAAAGGYFGSRLMTEIRERQGLTYGISATMNRGADGAFISISSDTDNANTGLLIEAVKTELSRMASAPPRGDELTRFKRVSISQLAKLLNTPFSISNYHQRAITSALPPDYFNEKMRSITAITPEIMASMAEKYLNGKDMRIAIAGSVK